MDFQGCEILYKGTKNEMKDYKNLIAGDKQDRRFEKCRRPYRLIQFSFASVYRTSYPYIYTDNIKANLDPKKNVTL
jgi:hypothetical protein